MKKLMGLKIAIAGLVLSCGASTFACSEVDLGQKAAADLMGILISVNAPGTFSDTDKSIAEAREALLDVPGAGEVIVTTLKVNVHTSIKSGIKNQAGLYLVNRADCSVKFQQMRDLNNKQMDPYDAE